MGEEEVRNTSDDAEVQQLRQRLEDLHRRVKALRQGLTVDEQAYNVELGIVLAIERARSLETLAREVREAMSERAIVSVFDVTIMRKRDWEELIERNKELEKQARLHRESLDALNELALAPLARLHQVAGDKRE
jgi:hypothetical protein